MLAGCPKRKTWTLQIKVGFPSSKNINLLTFRGLLLVLYPNLALLCEVADHEILFEIEEESFWSKAVMAQN